MRVVNLHAAKTHLSRLVDDVEKGAEITIAKAGRPVARLVAALPAKERAPGLLRGKIEAADDFDAALPADLLAMFEGAARPRSQKPRRRK